MACTQKESTYSRVGSTKESSETIPPTPTMETPSCNNSRTPTATSTNGAPERGMYFPETAPAQDPTEHFFQKYQNTTNTTNQNQNNCCGKGEHASSSVDAASPTTTSSRDEASVSISNASDVEITEWVAEDEPGVYITIRQLVDGTRELRRVRFR